FKSSLEIPILRRGPFGSFRVLIVDHALVKNVPVLRAERHHFSSPLNVKGQRNGLLAVTQVSKFPEVQFFGLLSNILQRVISVTVYGPDRAALFRSLVSKGQKLGRAFACNGAARPRKKKYNGVTAGPVEFTIMTA